MYCAINKTETMNEIKPKTALEMIGQDAYFIDVREKDEVDLLWFDVPNVQLIPFSTFDENYLLIPKDKNIIIACHLGIRSQRVAQFLEIQGWNGEKLFSLEGGIDAWNVDNLPIKKAARRFSMVNKASNTCCVKTNNHSCC